MPLEDLVDEVSFILKDTFQASKALAIDRETLGASYLFAHINQLLSFYRIDRRRRFDSNSF